MTNCREERKLSYGFRVDLTQKKASIFTASCRFLELDAHGVHLYVYALSCIFVISTTWVYLYLIKISLETFIFYLHYGMMTPTLKLDLPNKELFVF